MALYIPGRGDIIYLNFSPQAGHEQSGKRPASVLSSSCIGGGLSVQKADTMLEKMKAHGFYSPVSSITDIVWQLLPHLICRTIPKGRPGFVYRYLGNRAHPFLEHQFPENVPVDIGINSGTPFWIVGLQFTLTV